jgi:hypothetical protein
MLTCLMEHANKCFMATIGAFLFFAQAQPFPILLRSHKEKRSCYAPETGVRYDGVYRIEKCWRKKGIQVGDSLAFGLLLLHHLEVCCLVSFCCKCAGYLLVTFVSVSWNFRDTKFAVISLCGVTMSPLLGQG